MATYLPNVTDIFPDPATYTPDFSFLDQMLKRRASMYEQGYAEVASKYNYLNRELTNPMNVAFRDKFLKQAQQNLKNLSAMDLSIRQNVDAAGSVFEPFYKNRTALGDMALTEHWNQQENIAESLRIKDGGKEFSEDNLAYVRQQRQQFAGSDPALWKQFYDTRRSFTPYYNYYQEVAEAMKNFKPSSVVREFKDGKFTISRVEDKSWYKEELAEYLNGVLSDKAKNQMNIEASVRLANNPEALASMYSQEAQKSIPIVDKQLDVIKRELALEKDPQKREVLRSRQEYYTNKRNEINDNLDAIQNGDLTYIQNNSEKLARVLYNGQKVEAFIDAYDHKDISQEIKFNDAALTIFKEEQANWRTMYTQQQENYRASLKEDPLKTGQLLTVGVPGEKITASSKSDLRGDIDKAEKALKGKHQELKDHIAIVLGGGRTGKDITEVEFQNYIKNNPGDKIVAEYTKTGLSLKTKKEELATFDANAEQYAKDQMGTTAYENLQRYLDEKKRVVTSGPKVRWDSKKGTYVETVEFNGKQFELDKGKDYYVKGPTGKSKYDFDKEAQQTASKTSASRSLGWGNNMGVELEEQYKKLKKDYYDNPKFKEVTSNRTGFQLNTTDARFKSAVDFLQQNSGIDKSKILSITYVPTPKGLDIIMGYADTKENKVDGNAAKKLLQTRFRNNDVVVDDNLKTITIKASGSQISPMLDPYSIVEPIYRDELMRLEQKTGRPGATYDQPFIVQDRAGRNLLFRITKSYGNTPEGDGYYLYGEGTSKPLYDIKFDNALAPYKIMTNLLQENPANLDLLLESKK